MTLLDRAISLAVEAHAGQTDKAGEPYILHPLRVMLRFTDETERIVAVLADVVEDSGIPLYNLLLRGFPKEVVDAIDALTRRPGEPYTDYIERLYPNPLARKIKLADLADNLDPSRSSHLTEWMKTQYQNAVEFLEGVSRQ